MSDQSGSHVHWHDDGRGKRLVFVDGVQVERVIYADTSSGVAVAYDGALTCSDGVHVDIHPVCGHVEVVSI